jgi:hypothetical protein
MNGIRDDLKAFLDGELAPERMAEIQAAIASDPALAQEAEYMRVLGVEIKRLAAEPAVAGKDAAVERLRRASAPLWSSSTLFGRLAYSFMLLVLLGVVAAILFPVFAQSKSSARRFAPQAEESVSGADASAPSAMPLETPATGGEPLADMEERAQGKFRYGNSAGQAPPPASKSGTTESKPQRDDTDVASNRMVIKNADISIKVEDAKKSLTEVEQLAKSLGGFVQGGRMSTPPQGVPEASAVLRVPASRYETAMKALRGMGELLTESSNAEDVTAQHADVQGRLTVLRAEADSYLTMLRAARKVGELIEIKDRLSQVRQEIASLESQRKALANASALSTISVTLIQKESLEAGPEPRDGFDETWAKAVNGLSAVGRFLGNAVIYLFVFSPIWLPPVLLFWWLGRKRSA